jgi:hypothetical protein
MRLRRRYDVLEHRCECLTALDGCFGKPFRDRVNLVPEGLPFGALASQVEIGEHAFEPIDHFGMVLKPRVGATLVNKGFDLVHSLDLFKTGAVGKDDVF